MYRIGVWYSMVRYVLARYRRVLVCILKTQIEQRSFHSQPHFFAQQRKLCCAFKCYVQQYSIIMLENRQLRRKNWRNHKQRSAILARLRRTCNKTILSLYNKITQISMMYYRYIVQLFKKLSVIPKFGHYLPRNEKLETA